MNSYLAEKFFESLALEADDVECKCREKGSTEEIDFRKFDTCMICYDVCCRECGCNCMRDEIL